MDVGAPVDATAGSPGASEMASRAPANTVTTAPAGRTQTLAGVQRLEVRVLPLTAHDPSEFRRWMTEPRVGRCPRPGRIDQVSTVTRR